MPDKRQGDLFSGMPPLRAFSGETYDAERDYARLKGQFMRVFLLMLDSKWRTLAQIRKQTGNIDTEAAISARLRDFRKKKYGSHVVERLHLGGGLWTYRLIIRNKEISDAPDPAPPRPALRLSPEMAEAETDPDNFEW